MARVDQHKTALSPAQTQTDIELGISVVQGVAEYTDWSFSSDTRFGSRGPRVDGTLGKYLVLKDRNSVDLEMLWRMSRHDGQARAMLKLLTLPIRGALAKGRWIAPEGEDPEGPEVTFANNMWNLPAQAGGMSVPKSRFLRQTLLSLMFGFSAFEKVFDVPTVGPNANKLVLRKLAYRDPRTVTFLTDETGGYGGFRQRAHFADQQIDVKIPVEYSYYFAANEEENPFYGISYFEPAYQHYEMKKRMYYMAHLGAQFSAVPGRLGFYPAGASRAQLTAFRNAIANFTANASMLVPPNFEVKPFSAEPNFDFLKYIDHHNMQMTASILAKFLQQEDRQVLIDNGKGDASADMFVQMLVALSDEIAESWSNHIIPDLIDANFDSGVYPLFQFAPITDDQRETLMTIFTDVTTTQNGNVSPQFVLETEKKVAGQMGYNIDYEKVAEEQAAKQEADQAVKDAQNSATIASSQAQEKEAKNPTPPVVAPAAPPRPAAGGAPRPAAARPTARPAARPARPAAPRSSQVKLAIEEAETLDDMIVVLSSIARSAEGVVSGQMDAPEVEPAVSVTE